MSEAQTTKSATRSTISAVLLALKQWNDASPCLERFYVLQASDGRRAISHSDKDAFNGLRIANGETFRGVVIDCHNRQTAERILAEDDEGERKLPWREGMPGGSLDPAWHGNPEMPKPEQVECFDTVFQVTHQDVIEAIKSAANTYGVLEPISKPPPTAKGSDSFVGWGEPLEFLDKQSTEPVWGLLFAGDRAVFKLSMPRAIDEPVRAWRLTPVKNNTGLMLVAALLWDVVTTHEKAENSRARKLFMKKGKPGAPPPAFYLVTQEPLKRRNKPVEPGGTHASPSFQHSVRGHYAHIVKRKMGELTDRERRKWERKNTERRSYRFITHPTNSADQAFLDGLAELAPGKGQYLRITRFFKKGHVRGPEDTELVPSIKVMGPNLATHPLHWPKKQNKSWATEV